MLELNKQTSMENIMMINGIFNRFRITNNWSFMACKMLCVCFIISTFAFAQRASGGRVPLDPNWVPLSHEEKMLLIEQSTPTINSGNIMSNSARQGGDTFADAVAITFPYNGTGTTVGYANDYGPFDDNTYLVCDWGTSGSWGLANDVVYKLTLLEPMHIEVNLDGSDYDTALGVYDSSNTALVLANDDYNGLQSYLECDLPPGTYYIVVDGYSTSEGNYVIAVQEFFPPEEFADIEVSEEEAAPGEDVSVIVNIDAAGYMLGAGSFTGEYYQGNPGPSPEFGELVLTREDPVIDFYWGSNPPDPSMESEHFQVRWTGDIYANEEGSYQFRTYSDDGARLIVDGDTLIDAWYEGAGNAYADVSLNQGAHELVLEYYENGGGANVSLYWSRPFHGEDLVHPEGSERVLNAAQFQFAGFQNHPVDFTGISLDSSFDDWSMDYNNTDSVLYVAMAGANGVHMSELGTLFTLDFQINDDAPEGDVPVDVVHGLLNTHNPFWEVEQGGILVLEDLTPDLPPTEFDLLSPDDGSTVFIDQSNLNESTTLSWEASTDPEGNDISYAAVFRPHINLPDGSEFFVGASMNFLESTSTTIPHQDVVAALSAQGAATGWVDWNVVASDGEFFPALALFGGHVEVPNSDNLNFGTGNFAISLWFEHYGVWDSLQVSQQLLVKHNINSDRYEIQLNRMDDGMVELIAHVGDDVMSANREVHTNHVYHLVLSLIHI